MGSSFHPEALADFARHHGFHYDIIDPVQLVRDIATDIDRGLRGESSSLPMIPTYISPGNRIPPGKTVIALDAGGTNLRAARVRFDENGRALAEDTRKAPMPGTRGRLGAEQFFDAIADLAGPLLEEGGKVEGIGFCFSYPMETGKDGEGILMAFSKEVDAPEVIGRAIGAGLREALARRKLAAPKITLLNDTAATLLCGALDIPADDHEGPLAENARGGPVIGCILGTGFNTAYPETNIPKIGFHDETAPQIVVCETGSFAPRYLGSLDREHDAFTRQPGAFTQEKATAGAYLGSLNLYMLKRAVRDGVVSFRRSGELLGLPALETRDLNSFLRAPLSGASPLDQLFDRDETDALASVLYLSSIITERAALLSAATLAATVERMDAGCDPLAPVRIAVEGTTYVLYRGMRKALEARLHTLLVSRKPRSCIIAPVEQASLFGAAVAALTGQAALGAQ
jgi:hexokinase